METSQEFTNKFTPNPATDWSGPDLATLKNVWKWLLEEPCAISATVSLRNHPHVAVVHRSGWVDAF